MPDDVVDAEVVSTELVPAAPSTLFHTDDPVEVVERASRTATALKAVIDARNLTVQIQGRPHVRVEGWTLLGSMLGVFPVTVRTEREKDETGADGWHAWVEARRPNAAAPLGFDVVGASEATCMRSEKNWKGRDDHALLSMAQTRASSKALASALRFVMDLAGYASTPAEEMTHSEAAQKPKPTKARLNQLLKDLAALEDRNDWKQIAKDFCEKWFEKSSVADLTQSELGSLIDELERQKAALEAEPGPS